MNYSPVLTISLVNAKIKKVLTKHIKLLTNSNFEIFNRPLESQTWIFNAENKTSDMTFMTQQRGQVGNALLYSRNRVDLGYRVGHYNGCVKFECNDSLISTRRNFWCTQTQKPKTNIIVESIYPSLRSESKIYRQNYEIKNICCDSKKINFHDLDSLNSVEYISSSDPLDFVLCFWLIAFVFLDKLHVDFMSVVHFFFGQQESVSDFFFGQQMVILHFFFGQHESFSDFSFGQQESASDFFFGQQRCTYFRTFTFIFLLQLYDFFLPAT
ncbi:hypothetical protein AGLY_001688 [Aphis glycines]|uniref:Uncharacterized protein n=1 Tax=Aphis glycines TaxID=307491 RepID=A0A6G0U5V0_APHGL|nr:hypothetical protein AGLY_001688 [Aphis glycines]